MIVFKFFLSILWVGIIYIGSLILKDLVIWASDKYETFIYFFYGMGAYVLFGLIVSKRSMLFFDVFFHELSHAIFAFLTLSPLRSFVVSPHSYGSHLGYIEHTGSKNIFMHIVRAHLVSLAPYFFAPITVVTLGIYYMLSPYWFAYTETMNILLAIIGFSYLYHLSVSIRDMRPYQSDFYFLGFGYSMVFVIMVQILFLIFLTIMLSIKSYSFYQFELILDKHIYDLYHVLIDVWSYSKGIS